jgi:hypothetical protein
MNHHIAELSRFSEDRLVKFSTHEAAILKQMRELQYRRIILKELKEPSNIHEVTSLLTSSNVLSNIQLLETTEFGCAAFVPGMLDNTFDDVSNDVTSCMFDGSFNSFKIIRLYWSSRICFRMAAS